MSGAGPCPTIRGYRGSLISGPVSRSATAFNFCIWGQIRLTRHLVIGSQGPRFRAAARRLSSHITCPLSVSSRHRFLDALEFDLDVLGKHFLAQDCPQFGVEVAGVNGAVLIVR